MKTEKELRSAIKISAIILKADPNDTDTIAYLAKTYGNLWLHYTHDEADLALAQEKLQKN